MHRIVLRPAGDDWGTVDDVLADGLCNDPEEEGIPVLISNKGRDSSGGTQQQQSPPPPPRCVSRTLAGAALYVDGKAQVDVEVTIFASRTAAASSSSSGKCNQSSASVGAIVLTNATSKYLVDGVRITVVSQRNDNTSLASQPAPPSIVDVQVVSSDTFIDEVLHVTRYLPHDGDI